MRTTRTPLDTYCAIGHRSVQGWLLQGAINTIVALAAWQRTQGIDGPICEIGVHHGRLFILLHLLSAPNEQSLAIDLFDMQDENIDHSGSGSQQLLLHNLHAHKCDLTRVQLLTENSLRLEATRIIELCNGHPRLFSIDGGHTAEATCNDLLLAHEAVSEGGIAILDDYFNPEWPAVSEGACLFMQRHNTSLLPVAITSNKFFFAKGTTAAMAYRRHLQEIFPRSKVSRVFGNEVLCFERPTRRDRFVASPPWQRFRGTAIGQALRLGLKRWL